MFKLKLDICLIIFVVAISPYWQTPKVAGFRNMPGKYQKIYRIPRWQNQDFFFSPIMVASTESFKNKDRLLIKIKVVIGHDDLKLFGRNLI